MKYGAGLSNREIARVTGLSESNVGLDRKILSDLAITDPASFKKVVETAQAA